MCSRDRSPVSENGTLCCVGQPVHTDYQRVGSPIGRPPIFFAPALRAVGIEPDPNVIYPLYLYALVLLIVGATVLVNRRLVQSRRLAYAVESAYQGMLPVGRHPVAVVRVTLPPDETSAL